MSLFEEFVRERLIEAYADAWQAHVHEMLEGNGTGQLLGILGGAVIREDTLSLGNQCMSSYRTAKDPCGRWPEMEGKRCQSPEGHPGAHVWAETGIDTLGPFVSWP